MAEKQEEEKRAQHGRGPMGMGGGPVRAVTEKAKDFKGSIKRLVKYLSPYKISIIAVIVFAILSTIFAIVGPKIMGNVTTEIFNGIINKYKGIEEAGIDFTSIGKTLIFLIGLYVVSNVFSYLQQYLMAGVSQKTVYNLRKSVSEKLHKLPLKYYDSKTNGEILSRITNDIDTISTNLQQGLTQIISSVATIIGTIIMMLTISWQMTLISLCTIPVSLVVAILVAKKSQKYYIGQQRTLRRYKWSCGRNVFRA